MTVKDIILSDFIFGVLKSQNWKSKGFLSRYLQNTYFMQPPVVFILPLYFWLQVSQLSYMFMVSKTSQLLLFDSNMLQEGKKLSAVIIWLL